jgi:hypothetical protein
MNWYVGQQVYCLRNGEGVIKEIYTADGIYKIEVEFSTGVCHYRVDGRITPNDATPMLYPSKPEIILPKWQPKEGEWCWFWDGNDVHVFLIQQFSHMVGERYCGKTGSRWQNCAPFKGELPEHLKEVEK